MIKKTIKSVIVIILLIILSVLTGCRKKAKPENGWNQGRYDLAANISHAKLDKICYDLGIPSARKLLKIGWGRDRKSIDGKSYVKAKKRTSIIQLPPMSLTSRILKFKALPFLTNRATSASVALYFNGHLLKRIKLLPGWKSYSIPIKGDYFSLKRNILLFEHSFEYSKSIKPLEEERKKPSVAYDKLYLIKKELSGKEEKIKDNFIRLNQLRLAGDTRPILETRANNQFSYELSLSSPAELHFSLGLSKNKVAKIEKLKFQILARKNGSAKKVLFSQSYHKNKHQLFKNWNEFKVNLSPFKGSTISLIFKTRLIPKKKHKVNTICWGNPFIIMPQSEGKEKLNVIIYLVDTLRADHLGCYGNPQIKTPNIDKFASEGVLFERAFAQASWTKPSTASLLTSTYPSYHGAIKRADALNLAITTLAEFLRDSGYLTGAFHNQVNISADFNFFQGFDSYVEAYSPLKERPLYSHHMNKLIFAWLKKNADTPFFLYIHTNDPHDPYNPPPPFNTMYDKDYKGSIDGSVNTVEQILHGKVKVSLRDIQHLEALYNGEVTINDLAFGELIEKLKKLQLYDRTLIIFISDHGEEFWEHQGVKHALTLYEEVIHIPLIMRYPSQLPSSKRIKSMVRIIDIMPTILELLNLPIPSQCQGESLIRLIKGEAKSLIEEIYCEEDFGDKMLQSIRGRRWKLITYPNTGKLELFNLEKDPKEKHNLEAKYPELTNSLMKKIILWHQEQIDRRAGLLRIEAQKLSQETIKQLKALGYLN